MDYGNVQCSNATLIIINKLVQIGIFGKILQLTGLNKLMKSNV